MPAVLAAEARDARADSQLADTEHRARLYPSSLCSPRRRGRRATIAATDGLVVLQGASPTAIDTYRSDQEERSCRAWRTLHRPGGAQVAAPRHHRRMGRGTARREAAAATRGARSVTQALMTSREQAHNPRGGQRSVSRQRPRRAAAPAPALALRAAPALLAVHKAATKAPLSLRRGAATLVTSGQADRPAPALHPWSLGHPGAGAARLGMRGRQGGRRIRSAARCRYRARGDEQGTQAFGRDTPRRVRARLWIRRSTRGGE